MKKLNFIVNVLLFGIILSSIMIITGCTKRDGSSASGSLSRSTRIQYDSESDFEAEPISGGQSVRIVKYLGDKWEVNIPPQIRNLPVTHIGNQAFQKMNLINVTIPNSVLEIEDEAFASNQLTNIIIPNSVIKIGDEAFANNQLNSIIIPDSVTYLSGFNNNQISSVVIPNSVTIIGNNAFSENAITNIIIPDNVIRIGYQAFFGNQLTDIFIPESVIDLGHASFDRNLIECDYEFEIYGREITLTQYNGYLHDIIIPESIFGIPVTAIANGRWHHFGGAFGAYRGVFSNRGITSVIISKNMKYIGDYAFYDNVITNVVIPDNVISIGYGAFNDNPLTSITIGVIEHFEDNSFPGRLRTVIIHNNYDSGTFVRPDTDTTWRLQ